MSLIFHELGHILITLGAVYVLIRTFPQLKETENIVAAFVTGIFVDIDHLLDYMIYSRFNFNPVEFLKGDYFSQSGLVIVLLHSWELVIWLLFFALLKRAPFLIFAALGLFMHLLWDIVYYGFDPQVYFVVYRSFHLFSSALFH